MKNLKLIREQKGYTQKEFANLCNIAPSTYNQYETGKRQPDIETLLQIANALETSVDAIINNNQAIKIPVFGEVAAGIPISAIEDILDYEEITEDMAHTGEYFGLMIKGDSMEPRMKTGDIVIVKSQPTIENGEIAIVMVNGDTATCKKIKKTPEGIMLLSFNPAHEPIFYTNNEIEQLPVRILGKVVELRAKF